MPRYRNRHENATAVIWNTLSVAEQSFRRLDAPERLPEVAEGVEYVDGVRQKRGSAKAAPHSLPSRALGAMRR